MGDNSGVSLLVGVGVGGCVCGGGLLLQDKFVLSRNLGYKTRGSPSN